jgi:nucleoside phosphorylase
MAILVCFAVKEESRPFERLAGARPSVRVLLTGMGRDNASKAIHMALARERPGLVLSCGLAGGLNPELATGAVLFGAEKGSGLESALVSAGAREGRFHCADQVATTVEQKQVLWQTTGADAVEMESQAIRGICQEQGIPIATVRVILDTARENLPLDFNRLMTPERHLDWRKLTLAILNSPGKISALLRLQRQTRAAAQRLAEVLVRLPGLAP